MQWEAKGLDDLLSKLAGMEGDGLALKVVKAGLSDALKPTEEAAKAGAPVDKGKLRAAIDTTKGKVKNGVAFANVRIPTGKGVAYGFPVVYGYHRGGKLYPPNNFLQQAAASTADQVKNNIMECVAKAVDDAMSKG